MAVLRMQDDSRAADLSPEAFRERAFKRECGLIAQRDRAHAAAVRKRAGRLALNSNGRRKLERQALELEQHAELMQAASR